jgi:hypothetical protein
MIVPAAPASQAVPGPGAGGRARDTTAPVISGLTLSPTAFRALRRGGSYASIGGTRVAYHVSEAATVTFVVKRAQRGRRRGRSCVAPSAKLSHGRACTRYVLVRGVLHRSPKGARTDRFRFTGRLGGRTLARGRYRLTVTAVDAAGNRSRPTERPFRVT